MRPRARVTSKGRVTIPKDVRERLGLKPGDEIEFVEDREGFRLRKHIAASVIRKYRGHFKHLAGRDPDELVERMRDR
jgi:antitoxin PrlF